MIFGHCVDMTMIISDMFFFFPHCPILVATDDMFDVFDLFFFPHKAPSHCGV